MQNKNYNGEVLHKFSKDLINTDRFNDPMINRVVLAAIHGECPYRLIEELLIKYKELSNDYTKMVLESPMPKTIIVSELQFDEVKKNIKPTYDIEYQYKQREADEIVNFTDDL